MCQDQAVPNSPELSLLKFLPLTYHHSHFLAATLDFTSFFTIAFLRAALFFLQLGCFGLDIYIHEPRKHVFHALGVMAKQKYPILLDGHLSCKIWVKSVKLSSRYVFIVFPSYFSFLATLTKITVIHANCIGFSSNLERI